MIESENTPRVVAVVKNCLLEVKNIIFFLIKISSTLWIDVVTEIVVVQYIVKKLNITTLWKGLVNSVQFVREYSVRYDPWN